MVANPKSGALNTTICRQKSGQLRGGLHKNMTAGHWKNSMRRLRQCSCLPAIAGMVISTAWTLSVQDAFAQQLEWKTAASMPTARTGTAAVVFGDYIYVLGGEDHTGSVTDVVARFEPSSGSWQTETEKLRRPRKNAAATVWDGMMVVAGGRDSDNEVTRTVEFFNNSEQRWRQFGELVVAREGAQLIVSGDELYIAGGSDQNGQILNSVESYDPVSKEWKIDSDWTLDAARAGFAMGVVNDSLFALGGFDTFGPVTTVERYVPESGNATRASFLQARGNLSAATLADSIYAIGGRNSSSQVVGSTNIFLTASNTWRQGPVLLTPRERFSVGAVGDIIYVFGGTDAFGSTLSSVEQLDAAIDSGVDETAQPADNIRIRSAYPNPFQHNVLLQFERPASASNPVRVDVMDIRGRVVAVLANSERRTGAFAVSWNGRTKTGNIAAAGVYLVRITDGVHLATRSVVLTR